MSLRHSVPQIGKKQEVQYNIKKCQKTKIERYNGDAAHKRIAIVDLVDATNDVSKGCFRSSAVVMYMYKCVYVYVCVLIYMYKYPCVCVHMYTYIQIEMHMYVHIDV